MIPDVPPYVLLFMLSGTLIAGGLAVIFIILMSWRR